MLIVDNYDSFTYNLVQYFEILGEKPVVVKNDASLPEGLDFKRIVVSPGPGSPENSGLSMEVIAKFHKVKPILGICLGHQCIAEFFGGNVIKAKIPVHGKVSQIIHNSSEIFAGIPQNFLATRYHSLIVDKYTLPKSLEINAFTPDGVIMGLEHCDLPIYGLQFHPEAILTQYGFKLLENFICATIQ